MTKLLKAVGLSFVLLVSVSSLQADEKKGQKIIIKKLKNYLIY